MTYTFRPLQRERMPLLIGVAGGTGSGKTFSALRIARGLAGGKPFAGIDTENGRMSHYAELFPECHSAEITAPFRPGKYLEAIEAADKAGFPVVIVDSASHEWYGDGGCLDWHDDLMDGNQAKNLSAWIEPKREHKRLVTHLLGLRAHVILCFRAEPKVEAVKRNGKTEIVPKSSPTGLDGWIPIAERNLPYELTASFLLMADKPGIPRPIKLQEQHKPFVPLGEPLGEETGKAFGAWADKSAAPAPGRATSPPANSPAGAAQTLDVALVEARDTLVAMCEERGATASIPKVHEKYAAGDLAWLKRQIGNMRRAARQQASAEEPASSDEDQAAGAESDSAPSSAEQFSFVQQAHAAQERVAARGKR